MLRYLQFDNLNIGYYCVSVTKTFIGIPPDRRPILILLSSYIISPMLSLIPREAKCK